MTATYPADCYIVHGWFPAPINGWGDLCDGPALDVEAVRDALLSHFYKEADATLDAVMVLRRSDAGWRDVTEDVLMDMGRWLSDIHDPDDYPPQFAEWATDAMKEAMFSARARDRAMDRADMAYRARREGEAA